jgi:hypothetical protein
MVEFMLALTLFLPLIASATLLAHRQWRQTLCEMSVFHATWNSAFGRARPGQSLSHLLARIHVDIRRDSTGTRGRAQCGGGVEASFSIPVLEASPWSGAGR